MSETMEAGRELDALIAEHVLGKHVARGEGNVPSEFFGEYPSGFYATPKHYSTDIHAAWKVVVHLCPTANIAEPWFTLYTSGGKWVANFHRNTPETFAETAPLAICRAALLAYGPLSALPARTDPTQEK